MDNLTWGLLLNRNFTIEWAEIEKALFTSNVTVLDFLITAYLWKKSFVI